VTTRQPLGEDEILALHEAAHAVFAAFGNWTRLAGPIVLAGRGGGDVVMGTDVEAIRRTLAADPGFDRDLPRIELVRALVAGPMAERLLVAQGRARLLESDLADAGRNDYAVIAEQLAQLDPPRPGLLARLEQETRERLEQPLTWAAIERFAAILSERRRLEADEATAILIAIGNQLATARPGRKRRHRLHLAALLAALAAVTMIAFHEMGD
jgi:hypothetical protein